MLLVQSDNKIIFGVDSINNFRTTMFTGITKEIQRSALGIKLSTINHYCDDAHEILIFGYSFTSADKDSIIRVFDEAHKNVSTKITIFYKSSGKQEDDHLEKLRLSNNIKTILGDNYSKLVERITFKPSTSFFINL